MLCTYMATRGFSTLLALLTTRRYLSLWIVSIYASANLFIIVSGSSYNLFFAVGRYVRPSCPVGGLVLGGMKTWGLPS